MFKKILLAIAIILPMTAAAQKFGTVEVNSIFEGMPETTAAQAQLAEASKKYEDEFKKLTDEVDKKYQELQNLDKDPNTPQGIKDRRMQELQELSAKVEQFRNTASQDLQRQQQQLMAPIEQKIMDAIKAVGQEGAFTFIFQSGSAPYQGVDVIDVTPLVKTKLGLK